MFILPLFLLYCYRELFELRAQLQELKSTVEIRSLSAPDFEDLSPTKNPRRNDTLLSINGTDGLTNTGGGGSSISCSLPSDEKESIESEGSQVKMLLVFLCS